MPSIHCNVHWRSLRGVAQTAIVAILGGVLVVSGIDADSAAAAPPPAPDWLWRIDGRSPAEIFEVPTEEGGGFATGLWEDGKLVVPAGNDNIVDHVLGESSWAGEQPSTTTRFVSTTEDPLMPFFDTKYREGEAWLYKVRATESVHSVDSALSAVKGTESHSAMAEYLTSGESEWVALDGIPREQVHSAIHLDTYEIYKEHFNRSRFSLREIGLSDEDWLTFVESDAPELVFTAQRGGVDLGEVRFPREVNPHFADSASGGIPTRDPYPINEKTQCPSLARSIGCAVKREPRTAEELAELHGENFPEELGDLGFTTIESRLDGEAGVLLSPLTESTDVLRAVEAGSGVEGVGSLAGSLERSLAADLAVLEGVASHPSTVSGALSAVGKVGSAALELLPYAAIAATGYALSEDIKSGNWKDAAFDGAAEGLMVVGLVQPELMVFTEPALWVVLAVQFIVDRLTEGEIPPPQMSAWQRDQADQALQEWMDLPTVLAQMRVDVTEEQLIAATEHMMREKIIPAMQARLNADLVVLNKLENTYISEAHRHAVRAAGGIPTGDAFEAVREHRDAAFEVIEAAFAEQREARRVVYVSALGEQVQATADHFGLEWAAGSTVFDHIRGEFDEGVAVASIGHVEGVLHEFSRYQDPPVVYPSSGVGEFREGLRLEKFAAYEAEFQRVFPDPVRVVMPADEAEYSRLLAGKGPDGVVDHPVLWGASVPGGETTITIHDPVHPVTGVMLLTVPDGLRIVEVQAGDRPAVIDEYEESVLIGAKGALADFGGSTAPVRVRIAVDRGVPAGTVTGRMSIADDVKWPATVLSRADVAVVVRDTLSGTHAFGVPGGVTEEVVIHGGKPPVSGQVVVTAPEGAVFEQVRSGDGTPGVLSPDGRVATLPGGTFSAQDTVAVASLRVPGDATTDQLFTGGRVEIVKDDVVRTAGGLTVSTHPVSVSQTVAPSLLPNTVGQATVRVSNHTENTVTGAEFTIAAPSGAVFANTRVSARTETSTATHRGVLSEDGRSLTVVSDGIAIPGKGWIDYTITLLSESAGAGIVSDGAFALTGGALHPAGGLTTPVSYTSAIFPTQRLEAGPGKTTSLALDLPPDIDGRIDLHLPTGAMFSNPKATGGYEAFFSDNRRTLTVIRTNHSDTNRATLTTDVTLDKDARPTHDYPGTIQITRGGTTAQAGAINMRATTEGCITQENVPTSAWAVWNVQAKLTNSCQAWIDATVDFARSTNTTVPVGPNTIRTGETVWFRDGNYSIPQPHREGRIQPGTPLPTTPTQPVPTIADVTFTSEPNGTSHYITDLPGDSGELVLTAPGGTTFTDIRTFERAEVTISPDGKTIRVSPTESGNPHSLWVYISRDPNPPLIPTNGHIYIHDHGYLHQYGTTHDTR